MTKAAICTIGDEILIGQIVDTNSSAIASQLELNGIKVSSMMSIPDDNDEIVSSLSELLRKNDIVITTGGLGPTKDDITKDALARLSFSEGSYECEEQKEINYNILHSRGLDLLSNNKLQHVVPNGWSVIPNRVGTAPIMFRCFKDDARFPHSPVLYCMPGVPHETLTALKDVVNNIKNHFRCDNIYHKTIMTFGLAESLLAERIASWEDALPSDVHLAYLPNTLTGVRLRLTSRADDAVEKVEKEFETLKPLLGPYLYSERDDTIQRRIGEILNNNKETLSVAESCTGGNIAHLITTVPGSSNYFLGSVTSYAISVKENVLGVGADTIEKYGIVSSEVAGAMAEGIRKLTGTTYSVATTGYADGNGDEHYSGGTVWVGISGPRGTRTRRFEYHNDRIRNIQRFSAAALNELRKYIQYIED